MRQLSTSQWLKGVFLCGCLSLLCVPRALAQSSDLTSAEVYRLQNIVELLLRNQSPRPAKVEDILAPRDAMQTGDRSRAELLFNEGSVARIGSNSVFRFVPGTRRYQLPGGGSRAETILQLRQGVAMIASPAGGEALDGFGGGADGETVLLAMTSQTPDAQILMLPHTVAIVVVKPGGTQFISLTDGVVVSDLLGNNKLELQGGQTVTVQDGTFGPVEDFDLRQLYRTSELTAGLGPDQEEQLAQEPIGVRTTLRRARRNTLEALAVQEAKLEGLCTLDARGNASTLSSNCITTGADDPLSEFEDRREDTAPQPIDDPVDNDPGANDPDDFDPGANDPGANDPGANDPGPNDPGPNNIPTAPDTGGQGANNNDPGTDNNP